MCTPDTGRAGAAAKLLLPAGNVCPAFCAASKAAFLTPGSIVFAADATESDPYPYSMHVSQASAMLVRYMVQTWYSFMQTDVTALPTVLEVPHAQQQKILGLDWT